VLDDQEHPDQEREVANTVDDERLLAGVAEHGDTSGTVMKEGVASDTSRVGCTGLLSPEPKMSLECR
jgi:hypothetical protein